MFYSSALYDTITRNNALYMQVSVPSILHRSQFINTKVVKEDISTMQITSKKSCNSTSVVIELNIIGRYTDSKIHRYGTFIIFSSKSSKS